MAVIEGEPMTQQIVQGAAATLSITVYADGVLADPGVTTVTIARLDGSAVATDAATTGTGAAAREYALTAAETAALDVLAVTWQTANHGVLRQVVEIVGGVLFTIRQARACSAEPRHSRRIRCDKLRCDKHLARGRPPGQIVEIILRRGIVQGHGLIPEV